MSTDIPKQIGPFEVIRFLGAGGMGEVFLAQDPRLQRRVAIKRIRAAAGAEPERQARLHREAQLAAGLNHPTIVQVHDLLSVDGVDHIVMEYVSGPSLRRQLQLNGPLASDEGLCIARALADGLAYAHRAGVVHRDLKTENVLLTPEGLPKISDFGIARRLETHASAEDEDIPLTRAGTLLGTYRTMSPEQVCGDPVDHRSDLFSFGVLLYELFSGRSPFLAGSNRETRERVLNHHPSPLDEVAPGNPQGLSELIEHLLEKDPLLRPRNAEEVEDRLRLLSGEPSSALTGATMESTVSDGSYISSKDTYSSDFETLTGRRSMRIRWMLATLVAAVVVTATLLVVRWSGTNDPILYVAVLEPQPVADSEDNEATRLMALAVRNAFTRTLIGLEGVVPKAATEVDGVAGTAAEVARAVAADEVIVSTFACHDGTCLVDFSRVRAADSGVSWGAQEEVALGEPLFAAQALSLALREAYPKRSVRSGFDQLRISSEDYTRYLDVRRQFDAGTEGAGRAELLARLEAITASSPDFLDAYLLAAEMTLRQFHETRDSSALSRAFRLLEQAQDVAPDDIELLYTQARCETLAGQLDLAEDTLLRVEQRVPGHVRTLDMRALIYSRRGETKQAMALYREAKRRHPSAGRLFNYALLALRQGEIGEVRETLEEMLRRQPKSIRGRRLLATLDLQNGDLSRAVTLSRSLLEEADDSIDHFNLGLAYELLGSYDEAALSFERALERAPNRPEYVFNLAEARWLQGRRDDAESLFRRVVSLLEGDPAAMSAARLPLRALCLARLGEKHDAVANIQQALQTSPDDKDVIYTAALVFTQVGDYTTASVYAKRALELGYEDRWFALPWFDGLRPFVEF